MNGSIRIGTCSWNYESWLGLMHSRPSRTGAGYLAEYSRHFRMAEVDSWFYRLPEARDVTTYLGEVDDEFSFTVKATEDISLTHKRDRGSKEIIPNPSFLSPGLFSEYLGRLAPMMPRIEAVMLEFEYLNRDKMEPVEAFMKALETFVAALPRDLPLAVETRNKNYLVKEYFQFLKDRRIIHVFSEKMYMPQIYDIYDKFGDLIEGTSVVRLLGGDRAEIEKASAGNWNHIVDEKPDKKRIADMSRNIVYKGGRVIINIDNHYEGSAPLTARYFREELG